MAFLLVLAALDMVCRRRGISAVTALTVVLVGAISQATRGSLPRAHPCGAIHHPSVSMLTLIS